MQSAISQSVGTLEEMQGVHLFDRTHQRPTLTVSSRVWRFVDLGRRLDFLLAGFGWCKMPPFVVEPYLQNGRLVKLEIADEGIAPTGTLPIYAAHARDQPLGHRGSWLLENLRRRLMYG